MKFSKWISMFVGLVTLGFGPFESGTQMDLVAAYREEVSRLIGAAMTDTQGWSRLEHLCDRIGHRLSGSPQLEEALRWGAEELRHEGFSNVQLLPVTVPYWTRGAESLEVFAPVRRELPMLGLGMSVGTPPEGIKAELVSAKSFDELETLGTTGVAGKIVLFDVPWEGYGKTVQYRSSGASKAAKLGALAVLVRSAGPTSLQTPHTGALRYEDEVPQIPAAAVTLEGAAFLGRLLAGGERVVVQLKMEAQHRGTAQSANLIGEIAGRERPEEVVVLGGHIDSWDVGQGAHDDGAGVVAALQAVTLIKNLGFVPRRTIRVAWWTNEENGLGGGRAYRDWVGDKINGHVAAIEMDIGSEKPLGFGFGIPEVASRESAIVRLGQIGRLLESIEAGRIVPGGGGADIGPLMRDGVPGLGLQTVGEHYFDWHHTEADTLDKVDPHSFRLNVAALAIMAYVLADMPERLLDPD